MLGERPFSPGNKRIRKPMDHRRRRQCHLGWRMAEGHPYPDRPWCQCASRGVRGVRKAAWDVRGQIHPKHSCRKVLSSTLLAYEMNGEPLPLKHGFPLRGLVLGWTGANSVKWLTRIMVLDRPWEGHYMDSAYRAYQKGQDPKTGQVVKSLKLKAIITSPLPGETVTAGPVVISGAAYGGEIEVDRVEISTDGGKSWAQAEFIGPRERWSWRLWQYVLDANIEGEVTLMALAVGSVRKPPADACRMECPGIRQ